MSFSIYDTLESYCLLHSYIRICCLDLYTSVYTLHTFQMHRSYFSLSLSLHSTPSRLHPIFTFIQPKKIRQKITTENNSTKILKQKLNVM